MANDVKVVCKNVFKNSDTAALQKVFTMKWIELINQFEKSKGHSTPASCQTSDSAKCYHNISSDRLFCHL